MQCVESAESKKEIDSEALEEANQKFHDELNEKFGTTENPEDTSTRKILQLPSQKMLVICLEPQTTFQL